MLSIVEGRVLGCLLEKERTTPDQYPLTLNALVLACNQSTNREPVMNVDSSEVEAAITAMKAGGLVRMVHPSHGRSVTRYRHVADERYGWAGPQAALMAVLLVRGPQTASELKTRSERLHGFVSLEEVEATMRTLASLEEPFAVQLDRLPGQKEPRWQQLLAEEADREPTARHGIASHGSDELHARIGELEARVARLEAALEDLLS